MVAAANEINLVARISTLARRCGQSGDADDVQHLNAADRTSQVSTFLSENTLCGLFPGWIHQINPKNSGNDRPSHSGLKSPSDINTNYKIKPKYKKIFFILYSFYFTYYCLARI